MKNAIQEIIKNVPKGKIFDSHYVINLLISDYSDEYLTFASSGENPQKNTALVHGRIGQEIKSLSGLVEQVGEAGEFWSDNIRGNSSECTGWRKK
ncbi:MAG: hypothetical protein LBC75_12945 [Fibromonadaceae bacterium]|jgi:hypothetical protein|nr:hypothetical protein [Fibromonadaceae bacterium]